MIYALSQPTVVVASDREAGGTWAGATEALKTKNGQVAVWRGEGEGPGNSELERLGATPIKAIEDLGRMLQTRSSQSSEQLSLIDGDS